MSSGTKNQKPALSKKAKLRKLRFTHGIEIENFITNRNGDILEDGKELVAVWDQMFNGALKYLKSLTSSTTKVPEYIRRKIKRVSRKDVERHGKIIRYVQIQYQVNGESISINVFGPDPNISQITWLLEIVTPPCEYLEELDWWINTLYLAATSSITKGYHVQPLGFNPFQSEYRAGVTCGEHHHLGGFKTKKEKYTVYNMIRSYIPHLIALSNTSPFIDRKPSGRTILKKGSDGRTLILAPDCVRSFRLKENSGQLGPNIPEYLPYVGSSYSRNKFSRHVKKEIPDDRYVDAFPYTDYGTIEMRFFDAQFDQRIRIAIILLLQAIALKGVNLVKSGAIIPEVKGNTLYEHRKRAVNFGMFAKFQGDPSIESIGGEFVKYYNHNPETGGAPGKIFESLKSLLIWLKPEFISLNIRESDIEPLLIMLWGTARIAPPLSTATYMFYLYEKNHSNISRVIQNVSLLNGKPRKTFCEVLGRPVKSFSDILQIEVVKPKRTTDSSSSSLARKLQQDSKIRRKKIMAKEKARLKAKQAMQAKIQREKVRREKELERKRQERLRKLEKSKKPPPKPSSVRKTSIPTKRKITPTKRAPATTKKKATRKATTRSKAKSKTAKRTTTKTRKPTKTTTRKPTKRKTPVKTSSKRKSTRKPSKTTSKKKPTKKVITKKAIKKRQTSKKPKRTYSRKPAQAYASTATSTTKKKRNYTAKNISIPKPKKIRKKSTRKTTTKRKTSTKPAYSSKKTTSKLIDQQSYKESKIIRNVSISNLPSRVSDTNLLPAVKLQWRRSIIQSMVSLKISIEAEVSSLTSKKVKKRAFTERVILQRSALRTHCYLPIPINLEDRTGEYQIKFIVKNLSNRKIIAIESIRCSYNKMSGNRKVQIKKLSIPSNQVGDSLVNIRLQNPKRNIRGRIILWGISPKGVVKLYDKKARFRTAQFTTDLPIVIPLSIVAPNWYIFAEYNSRWGTATEYTKTSSPISKMISLKLNGNPPLKLKVKDDYQTEITPKLVFKVKCEIQDIEIIQITGKSRKVIKRYKMKTRIRKGEKFALESFTWKAPRVRLGLFRKYRQKTISFSCRVHDSVGRIDNSLINMVETPKITVYRRR